MARPLLDETGYALHVDVATATGGAGNHVHAFVEQAQAAQKQPARPHLLHRVAGEGNANGIADAVEQQAADAGGGFDEAGVPSPPPR